MDPARDDAPPPHDAPPLLDRLREALGPAHVLTGADAAPYGRDWTGLRIGRPVAVIRPGSTAEAAAALRLASEARTPVVPVSGDTGLTGRRAGRGRADGLDGADGGDRGDPRGRPRGRGRGRRGGPGAAGRGRGAGADAPAELRRAGHGAGGGLLPTNAGGAGALRHGSARALCLGVEAAPAGGSVLDLKRSVREDASGFDLRDLFVGAEGTLGLVTAAVVRLFPTPRARGPRRWWPRPRWTRRWRSSTGCRTRRRARWRRSSTCRAPMLRRI